MSILKYKEFVDAIVSIKQSVPATWVKRGNYPEFASNSDRNKVLRTFTKVQLDEIAKMMQEAKESGIHDLLALINQDCEIKYLDCDLPAEPFGTELYYDFVCRSEGDEWPQL